jgi:hypothetical protein
VSADGVITLDLSVEDSKMLTPEDGIPLGPNDKGGTTPATEFVTTSLTTRVQLTSGHAVLAQGVKSSSKSQQAQALVVVTARLTDAEGRPGK